MESITQDYRKPDHVGDELFVPGNAWADLGDAPRFCLKQRMDGRELVFLQTHHHPGHSPQGTWLACSAEVNRQILLDTESFSSAGATLFGKLLGGLTFFPVEIDPPEHEKYRAIIGPYFKPGSIAALKDIITARVDALLDDLLPKGGCEFLDDFSRILPATVFLDHMGAPLSRAREFLVWARSGLAAPSAEEKMQALRNIRDYLIEAVESRRADPQDDVLTKISLSEIDGRQITVDEAAGGALVLFFGGLDTVATQLGWIFHELAIDQEMQAELRNDPSKISRATEEFFRFFSSVTVSRIAARDIDIAGATIKAGDTVCCSMALASRDDREFSDADTLDISQPPRRHLAFGYGPHMCVGMHLAKLEVKTVLERWLARAPTFRLPQGVKVPSHGGAVIALDTLPLTWT